MADEKLTSGLGMVEELYAIEQIKKLKARYFRGVDTGDHALFMGTFTDDVVVDFSGVTHDDTGRPALSLIDSPEMFRGARAWTDQVMHCRSTFKLVSAHHGHMPEIDILSPTTAKAIWAMEDMVYWTGDDPQYRMMHGIGYYHETYAKIGGEWRIKTVKLSRLRVTIEPA